MGNLRIYLESLDYRIKEVNFMQGTFKSVAPDGATTDLLGDYLLPASAYADAFWALSYSLYDIFAHVLNCICPMVESEKDVSFLAACDSYQKVKNSHRVTGSSLPPGVKAVLARIAKSRHFKRLANYRHMCLHRRDVKIEARQQVIQQSASTTGPQIFYNVLVCDNPTCLRPSFNKQKVLEQEMTSLWDQTKSDILRLLRSIQEI